MSRAYHPLYGYMGFIKRTLEAQASEQLLGAHIDRMNCGPLRDAMWDGWYLLRKEALEAAGVVLERGHILLCWDGTKVLEDAEVTA